MSTVGEWRSNSPQLARLDCDVLLASALGCERAAVIAHPERPLPSAVQRQLNDWRERRASGEPLAYILGYKEFWGLSLAVSEDVLIPRPETELLVEEALARVRSGHRVLELGTGSGAIAIAIAAEQAHRDNTTVAATDVSAAALAVARRNGALHSVNVHWQVSDWFSAIEGSFDIIVSNPPYVAANDTHLETLRDPMTALVPGPTGMEALTHIITNAPTHLRADGWLLLEHGHDQAAGVHELLQQNGFAQISSATDLAGHPRVSWGRILT